MSQILVLLTLPFRLLARLLGLSASSETDMAHIEPKKNVVVVGGGTAGVQTVNELIKTLDLSKYHIVLITSREFFVHLIAMPRCITSEEALPESQVLIPYDRLFAKGQGTIIQATVTAIEPTLPHGSGSVLLSNGDRMAYEYLVLATGSKWPGPLNFPNETDELRAHIHGWRKKIAEANTIAIAGGGPVGIELAGEIRDIYTDKKIMIVHSQNMLLPDAYPDKFRKNVEQKIRARNAVVITGDILDLDDPTVTKRKKQPINADLMISCVGTKPNVAFAASLQSSLPESSPSVLSERGYIKTLPTMQLVSFPHIFAAGDVHDTTEQLAGAKYAAHAAIVGTNIGCLSRGRKPSKFFSTRPEMAFVTTGKDSGAGYIGYLWGLHFGNFMVNFGKGEELFVPKTRGWLGY